MVSAALIKKSKNPGFFGIFSLSDYHSWFKYCHLTQRMTCSQFYYLNLSLTCHTFVSYQ